MRFKRVYVEIGNICNLNCSFCSKITRPKKQMNKEEFLHIVKEIKPFTDYVYFHIKGEPLIHPLLTDFLDICDEYKLNVNLTTNGTLLKECENLILSKTSLRQINISLHSFTAHQGIDREDYLNTVLNFANKASLENKKYVVLRLWNFDNNRNSNKDSFDIMEKIKEYFSFKGDLKSLMSSQKSVMLEKGIFISWEEEFVWPSLANPFVSDTGICYGMRTMIGILADGTVVPCCLDSNGEAPLGNIFETPFKNIIESEDFLNIADNLTNRNILLPLCKHCSYRTRFDKIKTV